MGNKIPVFLKANGYFLVRVCKYFWCSMLCCQLHLIFLIANDRVHLTHLNCDCISGVFVVDFGLVDFGFYKTGKCPA